MHTRVNEYVFVLFRFFFFFGVRQWSPSCDVIVDNFLCPDGFQGVEMPLLERQSSWLTKKATQEY